MNRFPTLHKLLQAIVIASLPVAATACCGDNPEERRTATIDPNSEDYKPLVQACLRDDLSCLDLCSLILVNAGVADAESVTFQECRIMNAAATEVQMTYTFPYECVGGRRPEGLCGGLDGSEAPAHAVWFAQMAHLEGAAVYAFAHTAQQLARLGAPPALVQRALVAAHEEVVHATLMTELARAAGAEPPVVAMAPAAAQTVFELCLDNAVEGCVRETFGAVVATYQSRAAEQPAVRDALARIARDETEHAQLSRDIDAWARPQLSDAERARVVSAQRAAIDEVMVSAGRAVDPDLVRAVGLPDAARCTELVTALAASVWS